jgi:hypothetical protein
MEDEPPIPANDNFTKEQVVAFETYMSALGAALIANEAVERQTELFVRALEKLEAYFVAPALSRVTAERLFDIAQVQFEALSKRRSESPDTFAYDPGFIKLNERMEAVRANIQELP